jgi:Raf kinase inhibitor-like YbhB/YbcL family protein
MAARTLAWVVFALALPETCMALELRSADIAEGATLALAQVYAGDGCGGRNESPALAWSGAPEATRSFAVTVSDPDAPGGTWWHWVMFDLPPQLRALPRGAGSVHPQPAGAHQAQNDFGSRDYGGACPPAGAAPHRYVFTVHALKVDRLAVPAGVSAAEAAALIRASELDHGSITARYGR